MTELIELSQVSKHYHLGKDIIPALFDINLKINKGEIISIIGPSGSGKSTLLHLIGLMDHASKGEVFYKGHNIKKFTKNELAHIRGEKIGFIFQDFNLLNDLTIKDNIALPLLINSKSNKLLPPQNQKIDHLLEQLNISDRYNHRPKQVSGGQKQRAAIARALITNPEILIADEPTGNLDDFTSQQIINLLYKMSKEQQLTMIIVTHDKKIAEKADKIIEIKKGKIIKTS